MKEPKAWGTAEALHSTPLVKIARLEVKAGGFCSWHHHNAKDNTFIVEAGVLVVDIEPFGDGAGYAHKLYQGDSLTIPPGLRHRFVNDSSAPTRVLEVESLSGLDGADIHRTDTGGLHGATR